MGIFARIQATLGDYSCNIQALIKQLSHPQHRPCSTSFDVKSSYVLPPFETLQHGKEALRVAYF